MFSIREILRRFLSRASASVPEQSHSDFAYKVYWTKHVRDWSVGRRRSTQSAVERTVSQSEFVANKFERRYSIPEVDEIPHSGASLIALLEVLQSFDRGVDLEE
ncbi:MAG: hypothetical protein GTO14_07135 [Anaerolineales bacterium]|nr:hypothetical protein [Anaerolineales bacterium]